ncbi:porin [Caballeronia sp. GAWG2-1]|uniref:porin n=1 Tax=Caballeronia sp. GAWG2-1 TaxID=2921744 RepID=UPI002027F60C|nr:porin [Caballeronia sp. GAWG2-1]
MKQKILALAILGTFGMAAHGQSSVTLYGLIDAGITYANKVSTGPNSHDNLVKYGDGVASGSRWGLRGQEDLGGGLKAIFVLESGFNSGDGTLGQGGAEFGRQAFVGLSKNDIGALTFGRQYSFSTDVIGGNYTMGSQTPAGNYAYHINDLDQLTSSRINNSVKFNSASFYGVTFGAMYGFSNSTQFAGTPTTTGAGATQGSSSTYSFGLNYNQGPFGIGAAYTNIRFPNGATPAFSTNIANIATGGLRDLETYGVGARYTFSAATVWANWTHTTFEPLVAASSKLNNYEIGGKYNITPAFSAGLGYTFSKLDDNFEGKWHQINGAVDYALSKRTDVYLLGIYQKASGSNTVAGRNVPVQAEIGSSTAFIGQSAGANTQFVTRVGLRHRF